MPKQMEAGTTVRHQHSQQSQSDQIGEDRKQQEQLADKPSEQMRPMHFSDWASI